VLLFQKIIVLSSSRGMVTFTPKHFIFLALKIYVSVVLSEPVRLLVSARAYQPANSVFLSQQTSTSRAYQPKNQLANRAIK